MGKMATAQLYLCTLGDLRCNQAATARRVRIRLRTVLNRNEPGRPRPSRPGTQAARDRRSAPGHLDQLTTFADTAGHKQAHRDALASVAAHKARVLAGGRQQDLAGDRDEQAGRLARLISFPGNDEPAHLMGSAEQRRRLGEIALGDERPDPRRGHDLVCPFVGDEMDRFHGKTGLLPHRLQQRDVAPALVAEMEVVADDNHPGGELGHEHFGHEVLRRLLGALGVELDDEDLVNASLRQELELQVYVSEPRRGRRRIDDGGRVLVEGHDDTAQPFVGRPAAHVIDHLAMAYVNPVISPDGQRAAVVVLHRRGRLLAACR